MDYEYSFDPKKNKELKSSRGISFEEIIFMILEDKVLDILEHPNKDKFGHQKIFIIEVDNYAYLVPYVIEDKKIFLKTIFPSRKATKKYLEKKEKE